MTSNRFFPEALTAEETFILLLLGNGSLKRPGPCLEEEPTHTHTHAERDNTVHSDFLSEHKNRIPSTYDHLRQHTHTHKQK